MDASAIHHEEITEIVFIVRDYYAKQEGKIKQELSLILAVQKTVKAAMWIDQIKLIAKNDCQVIINSLIKKINSI